MAADKTTFDSRPNQISRDGQGSDNPIPLSPQWLLPKPGENKTGTVAGENNMGSYSAYSSRGDIMKSPGNGEGMQDPQKKKDVFRPSVLDMESGRRDRWRDEERETNSSTRKDRWRDGDKELGDGRKVDRWTDNSSGKQFSEARRVPTERWNIDSANKEANHDQRRESKWNTRWGPDDKEIDGLREKWSDSSKDGEIPLEKGLSHPTYPGKDEREGDHYRPWRSNASHGRGRGDPPHPQSSTPSKQAPLFNHGRGRGESTNPTFSLGRGRFPSGGSPIGSTAHLQSLGSFTEKPDSSHGESSPVRYSRTKLLDVYRMTDMRSYGKLLDGVAPVPSLTQEEPVEPLALLAPTSEELFILKGIDKGDILSSGAPQITKDGSVGRNSADLPSRRTKLGSREDLAVAADNYKDEYSDSSKAAYSNYSEGFSHEKHVDRHNFSDHKSNSEALRDGASHTRNDEVPAWRSLSIGERAHSASHDWRDIPTDVKSRNSDAGWPQSQKDRANEWDTSLGNSSYSKDGPKWQIGENSTSERQPSPLDREHESRILSQPSPDDLVLYYKDPQGAIQGPFAGSDIIGWFEAGYFGIDLLVRLANAPHDAPFALLGDVMPHLRAKVRPPPGFAGAKQNEVNEIHGKPNLSSFGNLHDGSSDFDMMKNDPRYKLNTATEAENRFLESLMSGNLSSGSLDKFGLSEGMQGYFGNNSNPALGSETGDNLYELAKRMTLERQKSLPKPYSFWPGRDGASTGPMSDILPDSAMPPSNILSAVADNLRQQPHSQNAEFMSILQGLSDRSKSGLNSGASGWSNFPVQGGVDPRQDKLDLIHGQNFPPQAAFGIQQRLQQHNASSLPGLRPQGFDNPAGPLTPEKLLATGISQDPQLLSLLQQQYLSQLQPQAPAPPQQMSILDEYLLLKQQQQKQEQQQQQQQQQLLLQQQLLSQVLSDRHSLQRFGEQSYGQLPPASLPAGSASVDHLRFQTSREMFQMGQHNQVPNIPDELASNFVNLPQNLSQDGNRNIGSEASSIHLPHQMFGNTMHHKGWGTSLPEQRDDVQKTGSMQESAVTMTSRQPEMANNYAQEQAIPIHLRTNEPVAIAAAEGAVNFVAADNQAKHVPIAVTGEGEVPTPEHVYNLKIQPTGASEEPQVQREQSSDEPAGLKEAKTVEPREVKKSSEKKSKKQKSSKAQSSDLARGVSKMQQPKLSETEGSSLNDAKSGTHAVQSEILPEAYPQDTRESGASEVVYPQQSKIPLPARVSGDVEQAFENKSEYGQAGFVSQVNTQVHTGQRAWKPAPGFKPKSLLEIQQEEQRKAAETVVSDISSSLSSMSFSTPWSGVVASKQDTDNSELNLVEPEVSLHQKSKKSQLHDLLADEVFARSLEKEIPDTISSLPPLPVTSSQSDSVDTDNFIEAKESKKNRKKSAKAKSAGTKVAVPVTSADVTVGPNDKGKNTRQVQQEKELLPAVPSGPSLGDFVVWKGDNTNPSPAPAWSTESGKHGRQTSLRDILKEQEKKGSSGQQQVPVPIPQKSSQPQSSRGNGPSWSSSASSPAKAASPIQINSQGSQLRHKTDEDLFWGPLDQPKQETKQSDFPQLSSQGSWGKNTPVKGTLGGSSSRQKSTGGRPAERSLSSSPALKGKKDVSTKHSEATDFRDWCESECVRLIGTKDTSFLEFCMKQSRSEAKILLTENLGSFDPDHEFIEKFLNYKDFLPADVLDVAFQSRNDRKVTGFGPGDVNSVKDSTRDYSEQGSNAMVSDGSIKTAGSKKKGKKGKKVSPAVLGFNVVSNRIMMGEIQTVED